MVNKKLSDKVIEELKEHSKAHKGGMRGKHMKNMLKFMKEGDTFKKAHTKSKKLDNKEDNTDYLRKVLHTRRPRSLNSQELSILMLKK